MGRTEQGAVVGSARMLTTTNGTVPLYARPHAKLHPEQHPFRFPAIGSPVETGAQEMKP